MIEFLQKHSDVDNFVEMQVLRKNDTLMRDFVSGQAGLIAGATNLIHGHFNHDNIKMMQAFATTCPVVIPLRDPLLALISSKQRDRSQHGQYLHVVDQFVDMVAKIDVCRKVYDPLYFPIDLIDKEDMNDRRDALRAVLIHTGLDDPGYSWPVAKDWPRPNSRDDDHDLKRAYLDGDFKTVKLHLPKEVERLKDAECVIRPLLERVGYRDLIWWG